MTTNDHSQLPEQDDQCNKLDEEQDLANAKAQAEYRGAFAYTMDQEDDLDRGEDDV
jgi:hypothetical protein